MSRNIIHWAHIPLNQKTVIDWLQANHHQGCTLKEYETAKKRAAGLIETIKNSLIEKKAPKDVIDIYEVLYIMVAFEKYFMPSHVQEVSRENANIPLELSIVKIIDDLKQKFSDGEVDRRKDIEAIGKILLHFMGVKTYEDYFKSVSMKKKSIIVAKDVDFLILHSVNMDLVEGFITNLSKEKDHAVFIASDLSIPFVRIEQPIETIANSESIVIDALDAANPRVQVNITPAHYRDALMQRRKYQESLELDLDVLKTGEKTDAGLIFKDARGNSYEVAMNINAAHSIKHPYTRYVASRLMRYEGFFPTPSTLRSYRETIRDIVSQVSMGVDIRVRDQAADKPGVTKIRGISYIQEMPMDFENQILAIMLEQAKHVMFPMVIDMEDINYIMDLMAHIKDVLKSNFGKDESDIQTGLSFMIETAGAVNNLRHILSKADSISIGLNDLRQYLLGEQRTSGALSRKAIEPYLNKANVYLSGIDKFVRSYDKEFMVFNPDMEQDWEEAVNAFDLKKSDKEKLIHLYKDSFQQQTSTQFHILLLLCLEYMAKFANDRDVKAGICGSIDGSNDLAYMLYGMGYKYISLPQNKDLIEVVKHMNKKDMSQYKELRNQILGIKSVRNVISCIFRFYLRSRNIRYTDSSIDKFYDQNVGKFFTEEGDVNQSFIKMVMAFLSAYRNHNMDEDIRQLYEKSLEESDLDILEKFTMMHEKSI